MSDPENRRSYIRKLLKQRFPDGVALRAFLNDCFNKVSAQLGGSMLQDEIITILLTREYRDADAGQNILSAINRYEAEDVEPTPAPQPVQTKSVPVPPVHAPQPEESASAKARVEAARAMRNSHALVIGINEYIHIGQLKKATNDAVEIKKVLCDPDLCGYPEEQVVFLPNREATRENILNALDKLASTTNAESTVFIFAASHGGRLESGPNAGEYLLPVDVESRLTRGEDAFVRSAISGKDFTARLSKIPASKVCVVLDCCYAEGVADLRSDDEEVRAGLSDSLLDAMAKSGRGRVILAAASANETAKELRVDDNGLFTKYILAGMRGAAGSTNPYIHVLDLYDYVERKVRATPLKTPQSPVLKAALQGNFPIALRAHGAERVPSEAGDRQADTRDGALPPCDRSQILDALSQISLGEFDSILFVLDVPRAVLPSQHASQLERAVALCLHLAPEGPAGMTRLCSEIRKRAPRVLKCSC